MRIVVAGAGAVGIHLAKLLSRDKHDCVLIDDSEARLSGLESNYDIMTIQGPPTSIKTLKDAGIGSADIFIGVTPNESQNINACILAHHLGAKKTVARIDNYEYLAPNTVELFDKVGINSLIYPEMLAAKDIKGALQLCWATQRWDIHDGALVLLGVKMGSKSEIINRPLKDICGPDDPYYVVAVKRKNNTIIPGGTDTLQQDDIVFLMTTDKFIPYVKQITGKKDFPDIKNIIIMGSEKTAIRLALMAHKDIKIKIIENDDSRCERLNQLLCGTSVMIIKGDGRDPILLEEEGIIRTQAFVALTDHAETNILACMAARRLGVGKTIAEIENLDYVKIAEELDIDVIVNKMTIAASHIYQMMIGGVKNIRSLMEADSEIAEFVAEKNSPVTKKAVKMLGLPMGMTIGGLVRDGKGMLVNGNTTIKPGDIVMVFCHENHVDKVKKYFKHSLL